MENIYKKLLTYAYNIIGSYEDAKDIVQDALEKYIGIDKSHIENETNYLIKTVINLSINLKNRYHKKALFGVWLPEPVTTELADTKLIKEQTANYTLLVLMEKLDAKERAVFILKEGFDYAHDEIAALLDISVENSRQLLTRSKKALNNRSFAGKQMSPAALDVYMRAIVDADIVSLEKLLTQDVRLMADGGQKVRVIKDIEIGNTAIAHLLQHVYALFLQSKQYSFITINHQPAICFFKNDRVYCCQIIELNEQSQISHIYSVVDPEKLRFLLK